MGNEMGNNNTSGLQDEDNTAQDKSQQEFAHTDDLKGENHVVPATLDKDSQGKETGLVSGDVGREDPNGHDQKPENKEEDNMKTEGKKSMQDAARIDNKEQNHEVLASETIYVNEKEAVLASINLGGVAEPHDDNQKQDEKDKEKSMQDAGYAVEAKRQDHLVPAAEDKNTHGNETEFCSTEHDGLASPHVDTRKQDEKEQDTSTIPEAEEIPLQEVASTDETNAEVHRVPAGGDENTNGTETGLVSSDRDGMTHTRVDKNKHDEKEEDININDEAEKQSSKEPASTDELERQDHLLAAVDGKNAQGNETGLVFSDPEGTADPLGDNPKEHEKEENNTNAEHQEKHLAKDNQADDGEEKKLSIPAAEGEGYNNTDAESVSGEPMVAGETLDNKTLKRQEQGKTELHPPAQSTKVDAKPSEAVEGNETRPVFSSKSLDDNEVQKESNFEKNLSGRIHHFENQNSMMEDDEGTRNSISGAASSPSHDSVPQELAVLEPDEHELAKIHTEQQVQVCSGPLTIEDMIILSLTCPDQENGFVLDSSISTDTFESVFPDQSLEVGKERDEFSVKEMVTKEVSSEEKFELKDGDEAGNNLGTITTIMRGLPKGFGAKCNGKLPSEMNSIKNDSPESKAEAVLSDETQKFIVEVSETEDKGIVLSQKATSVKEESENGNSKHSHCQIQSGEESIEKSNGLGSEEGSKADKQNASPPQFVMNGHQNEEERCLLGTSCDSKSCNKYCQFEEAKILESGHLLDASINYHYEATEEQQKESQKVQLVTDPAVISADTFLRDQKYKEEESEEKKIIEEMVEKKKDSNLIGIDTSRRENGEQCISGSYPIEQAEAFLSPSPFLHALPEKQRQYSDMECRKVQNSNESIAEVKEESFCEFSTTASFVTKNLTEKNVVSVVEFTGDKSLWDLSECPKSNRLAMAETKSSVKQSSEHCALAKTPEAIAKGDYYQQESVGRLSIESNPHNTSIHAQTRKSPSFHLDLRIDARAEESDQTPLLVQDKTTIESFSSQADVTDPGKPVANAEYGKNSLEYEAIAVEEKVVTIEGSDSDKSKTPFLGFLKDDEEADHMLINPKKQDNQSATKKATKVSAKEVTYASKKGKEKRKPRASLFGTCMCCATVIN
ncbi:midasin-like [Durio zibethinus]|uniref:Midasin-like n=1 Tax=Durio zibethinus TaxID=66656 RepID=A0A6P6A603_DURZI|nr:midasin-like [Durio zibethinus]